jgi:hypothetical protein
LEGQKWIAAADGEIEVEKVRALSEGDEDAGPLDSGEARPTMKLKDPLLPSEEDVRAHCLTHLPYRSWCHHCVRAKGRERDHKVVPKEERGLDEFSVDYCFPGDEFGHKLVVLVAVERHTGMKMGVTVPRKGSTGHYAARKVADLMEECGNKNADVIIKSDQEPAIRFLVDDVCKARTGAKTIPEESPVASKGSNGIVERAVQTIEGQIRALKSQLDERYKIKIDVEHLVVTWLVDYAAYLVNRLEVGKDGKTSYERSKGKKATVIGIEFGEKLLWKAKVVGPLQKINPRWQYGMFVGVNHRSGELYIATQEGKIYVVRTVKRIPVEHRWQEECLSWIQSVPWNMGVEDKAADGDIPFIQHGPGTRMKPEEMDEIRTMGAAVSAPRSMPLNKTDFEKFGYTDRCAGCSSILRGMKRQHHSEDCKMRMEKLLQGDARLENSKRRLQEYQTRAAGELKRGKLDELEEKAMTETDPEKLKEIYKQYQMEYMDKRAKTDGAKMTPGTNTNHEEATSSPSSAGMPMETEESKKRRASEAELADRADFDKIDINNVMKEIEDNIEETEHNFQEFAYDDVRWNELDPILVREARQEEVDYIEGRKIYDVVDIGESWATTGKGPTSVKWVDTNKADVDQPVNIRSRLVARDFRDKKKKDREDLYAATPPIESQRCLCSEATRKRDDGKIKKMLYIDVRKAHLNPPCKVPTYIDLPKEAGHGLGKCGRLNFWLYGFRPAGQAWETDYSEKMLSEGFVKGLSCPVVFRHEGRDLDCVVHGDDFTFLGFDEDLDWIELKMRKWYEIKIRGRLGPEPKDDKQIVILGRIVKWHGWGITWQADPRHRRLVCEHYGFTDSTKPIVVNGVKETEEEIEGEDILLDDEESTHYRAICARMNFAAQDCPNVQFPVKELCRSMSKPTARMATRLKRQARHWLSWTETLIKFPWHDGGGGLVVYVDADWAGCRRTRKSTSGGMIMWNGHCLKSWSSTQPIQALSVAEAEYYALVEGATRGIGMQSMLSEMGHKVRIELQTDSSSAKSFASRKGLGKMRHLDTKVLWVQDQVSKRKLVLNKVLGVENPADVMTKYHSLASMARVLDPFNVVTVATDRAEVNSAAKVTPEPA